MHNLRMMKQMLVAGSGIGGLAAALACARAGWQVRVLEKAPALEEVGAGIQIGPNVTRVLHRWGLESALAEVAAFPERLQVRNAVTVEDMLARRSRLLFLDAKLAAALAPRVAEILNEETALPAGLPDFLALADQYSQLPV